MVRCERCGCFEWMDSPVVLWGPRDCYHNGKILRHDWRLKDGSVYRVLTDEEAEMEGKP